MGLRYHKHNSAVIWGRLVLVRDEGLTGEQRVMKNVSQDPSLIARYLSWYVEFPLSVLL